MFLQEDKISNVSYPKIFKTRGKNAPGTLIIKVQRGNEIDIEYSKNIIIEKINSYFGYKILDSIKLETFSSLNKKINNRKLIISTKSKQKFTESLNSLKNKKIKKSLIELINTIQK